MTYYIEEGTMLTGDDCPVPTTVFAGWIDCPHCNNSRASVLRDAHDKDLSFKTDCGECDHHFPVTVVELNKYAYAYLKEIEFCDPEANLEWGHRHSFTADQTEKDRQTLLEIVRDELADTGKTSFDIETLFPDEDFDFKFIEMDEMLNEATGVPHYEVIIDSIREHFDGHSIVTGKQSFNVE